MLTLGTLVSLPSPVPRLNQKMFKPEYFEYFKKTQQANDEVADVKDWIGVNGGDWSSNDIRMWLPSVLKQPNVHSRFRLQAVFSPAHIFVADYIQNLPLHRKFSTLPWVRNTESTATALEEDDEYDATEATQMTQNPKSHQAHSQQPDMTAQAGDKFKFWLEEDDIGEF